MRCVSYNLNPSSMLLLWKGKLKLKIWLPYVWPLKTIESTTFPPLNSLILQVLGTKKWMEEEQRDYVSIVTTSKIWEISAKRGNYYTYIVKRKKINK
jgi:hypothetical protein